MTKVKKKKLSKSFLQAEDGKYTIATTERV